MPTYSVAQAEEPHMVTELRLFTLWLKSQDGVDTRQAVGWMANRIETCKTYPRQQRAAWSLILSWLEVPFQSSVNRRRYLLDECILWAAGSLRPPRLNPLGMAVLGAVALYGPITLDRLYGITGHFDAEGAPLSAVEASATLLTEAGLLTLT